MEFVFEKSAKTINLVKHKLRSKYYVCIVNVRECIKPNTTNAHILCYEWKKIK